MRRAAVLIAILLAVVATGCASAPTRATDAALIQRTPAEKTVMVNCLFKPQTRPSSFVLTCADANDVLADLHWVSWGSTAAFATGIEQINDAIKDKPAGLAITTHMCRGNFRSSWVASGGYDFVAEALFSELDVDGFFLEYDDERSGGFEPLRFVPTGKMVVLGLVTTKRPELESPDDLKRRIDEAAKFVPLDQICLSGQCGFSSTVEGNALSYDEQVAKLRLIVETARDIWGD